MTRFEPRQPLWFYRQLTRLKWPRSYLGKLFLVAFTTTHLPLLTLLYFSLLFPLPWNPTQILWLVLVPTVVAFALLVWLLHELVQPMLLATVALKTYFLTGQVLPLPTEFEDEVGWLLKTVGRSISTFEAQRQSLEQMALEDCLTGLPNRRAAQQKLPECFDLAQRQQLPLSLALLDIDHFKCINDQYGHPVGDKLLQQLAEHLQQTLRGSDWAARWGGEEFLLVLFSGAEGTQAALERLQQGLQGHESGPAVSLPLTVSIGFTVVDPSEPVPAALQQADEALYQAKGQGRNCIVAYSTSVGPFPNGPMGAGDGSASRSQSRFNLTRR